MSSKGPKFKSIQFTGMKTNRKLFNVEISHSRPTPHYKPRFFTNKNLFYVKNCRKYYSNKNKKKLKINFIKNQRKLLARRELRNKHCLFITQQFKQTTNSLIKKEGLPQKPVIKFKKRLKFKISTSKEKDKENQIINEIINNTNNLNDMNNFNNQKNKKEKTNPIIDQFKKISKIQNNNNSNNNLTYSEEDNFFTLSNNQKFLTGRWHLSEHKKFLEAIIKFGNDWKRVEKHIGTRSSSQARSHAQKFFIKLKEEQKNLKISKEIDYSNSTIKSFHYALQSMTQEKKDNIIKELQGVVFDNQSGNKKYKRKNNYCSESCTDGFISGTEFFEEYNFLMDDEKKRKMSVDSMEKEEKKDKRKFIEEKNDMFTDEEYEKSFHKVFVEKDGIKKDVECRKLSIEDDFMFNINI
jgi:SHAQKYF class myb-like DNA-binding protein